MGKRKGTMGSRKENAMSKDERIRSKRTKKKRGKEEMQCDNTGVIWRGENTEQIMKDFIKEEINV